MTASSIKPRSRDNKRQQDRGSRRWRAETAVRQKAVKSQKRESMTLGG
jgi:hypothetical protein